MKYIKKIKILILILIGFLLGISNLLCDVDIIPYDIMEAYLKTIIIQEDFINIYDKNFYAEIIIQKDFIKHFLLTINWEMLINNHNINKADDLKNALLREFYQYIKNLQASSIDIDILINTKFNGELDINNDIQKFLIEYIKQYNFIKNNGVICLKELYDFHETNFITTFYEYKINNGNLINKFIAQLNVSSMSNGHKTIYHIIEDFNSFIKQEERIYYENIIDIVKAKETAITCLENYVNIFDKTKEQQFILKNNIQKVIEIIPWDFYTKTIDYDSSDMIYLKKAYHAYIVQIYKENYIAIELNKILNQPIIFLIKRFEIIKSNIIILSFINLKLTLLYFYDNTINKDFIIPGIEGEIKTKSVIKYEQLQQDLKRESDNKHKIYFIILCLLFSIFSLLLCNIFFNKQYKNNLNKENLTMPLEENFYVNLYFYCFFVFSNLIYIYYPFRYYYYFFF